MKTPALFLLLAVLLPAPGPNVYAERVFTPPASEESAPDRGAATGQASAFFDIGVLIGFVEQGALKGTDPDSLVPHLLKIRERAAIAKSSSDFLPLNEIDALIEAMESAAESRDLYERIVEFRRNVSTRLARVNTAGNFEIDPPPFDCDIGSWEGVWETTWGDMTLVFDDEGRFHGTYGSSQHALTGEFDPGHPKVLRGRWTHFGSTSPGGIRFEMKAPGRFEGGWSNEIPVQGAGSGWSGTRRKTHHSEILIVPIGEASVAESLEYKVPIWTQSFLIKKGFSVHGFDVDFPFIQIYTLSPESGEWEKWGPQHDASDTSLNEIPAGRSFAITLSLPADLARRQVVAEFGREGDLEKEEEGLITLRTRPLRMFPPVAPPRGAEPDRAGPPDEVE